MGKKNIVIVILGLITAFCFVLGIIGLIQKNANDGGPKTPNYQIKYNYYIDDKEVDALPVNSNSLNPEYVFNRSSCTNKVVGEWNEEKWKFEPKVTNTATCKLYFNKAYYMVQFEIEYGELRNSDGSVMTEEEKEKGLKIEREKNLVAKIQPDEGYSLVSVECDKKNDTDWDKDNNELMVKKVKTDTKCKVKFTISNYEIDVKVSNGSGASTLTSDHGKAINVQVTPNTGYGNPSINCTNGQKGNWKDNKFSIEKIENSTSCTIEFKILTYEVKVNVTGGTATPSVNTVNHNSSKEFNITADTGYTITEGFGVSGCVGANLDYNGGKLTLTVSNVTSNLTCNVTLKSSPSSPIE